MTGRKRGIDPMEPVSEGGRLLREKMSSEKEIQKLVHKVRISRAQLYNLAAGKAIPSYDTLLSLKHIGIPMTSWSKAPKVQP